MRTLAERFITWPPNEHKQKMVDAKIIPKLQKQVREAHRFVFDEAATREVAKVVRDNPELIIREQRWARPPFELTWIEFPFWVHIDVLNSAERNEQEPAYYLRYARQIDPTKKFDSWQEARDWANQTGDHTLGLLIDHNRINIIVGGTREKPDQCRGVAITQYRLHTEWPEEDQARICSYAGFQRHTMDMFLWGSTYLHIPEEQRSILRNTNAIEITPLNPRVPLYPGSLYSSFIGMGGEFRTLIAMLLMLNRPTVTEFTEVPVTRGPKRWQSGATKFSYVNVRVNLNATHIIRKIGTPEGESVPRRRHEVREHYAHDQTAHEYQRVAGCLHNWRACGDNNWTPLLQEPPLEYEVLHWVCEDCGGKRWLRHEHERGDEKLGRVIHQSYEITNKETGK